MRCTEGNKRPREFGDIRYSFIHILDEETITAPLGYGPISVNPLTGEYLHVDFRQVDLKEEIKANVPLVFEGESPAAKQNLGKYHDFSDADSCQQFAEVGGIHAEIGSQVFVGY